jgi:hypothetical protein
MTAAYAAPAAKTSPRFALLKINIETTDTLDATKTTMNLVSVLCTALSLAIEAKSRRIAMTAIASLAVSRTKGLWSWINGVGVSGVGAGWSQLRQPVVAEALKG